MNIYSIKDTALSVDQLPRWELSLVNRFGYTPQIALTLEKYVVVRQTEKIFALSLPLCMQPE